MKILLLQVKIIMFQMIATLDTASHYLIELYAYLQLVVILLVQLLMGETWNFALPKISSLRQRTLNIHRRINDLKMELFEEYLKR